MKYTVVGYFSDNDQAFVDLTDASDPQAAVEAILTVRESEHGDSDNIVILEVFEGHHMGVLDK